jgi:hypothetical protein
MWMRLCVRPLSPLRLRVMPEHVCGAWLCNQQVAVPAEAGGNLSIMQVL